MNATPHLARIVKEYLNSFPSSQSSEISNNHYQLIGNMATRTTKNAVKLC